MRAIGLALGGSPRDLGELAIECGEDPRDVARAVRQAEFDKLSKKAIK